MPCSAPPSRAVLSPCHARLCCPMPCPAVPNQAVLRCAEPYRAAVRSAKPSCAVPCCAVLSRALLCLRGARQPKLGTACRAGNRDTACGWGHGLRERGTAAWELWTDGHGGECSCRDTRTQLWASQTGMGLMWGREQAARSWGWVLLGRGCVCRDMGVQGLPGAGSGARAAPGDPNLWGCFLWV